MMVSELSLNFGDKKPYELFSLTVFHVLLKNGASHGNILLTQKKTQKAD